MTNDHDLSRRKILGGIVTIGAAGAAAGAGTMAYFSDTEQSTGNTIEAGTLNLDAAANDANTGDGTATTTLNVSGSQVYPGASGAQSNTLKNTGSIDGELSLVFGSGNNNEQNNPESETNTSSSGDLGDVVHVTVKVGTTTIRSGTFNAVFDGTREWYDTPGTLGAGNTKDLTMEWSLPSWAGNDVQGDQVSGDIEIELVQSGTSFADVVVDATGGGDATTIENGLSQASQDDTILVKDGTYEDGGWAPIKKQGVTLVSENRHGAEIASTVTVRRSDVAVIGFEVTDVGGETGIGVEPDNGATSGVVLADNLIQNVDYKDVTKREAWGILAWSNDSNLEDIVVRGNTIRDIGRDNNESNTSQGYGVFIEGLSFDTGGATIENNIINNIKGGTQDSNTYPGVGVSVLPEHTNPDYSHNSPSKVGVGHANASVTGNEFSGTKIDVSVAGDIDQLVVADNTFNDSNYNVFTRGTSPSIGSVGIMNVSDSSIQESVVSGTARYIQ